MSDKVRIEVVLHRPDAIAPHRSRDSDAGWDIHSLENVIVSPGKVVDINTGMSCVAPAGYYFTVEGRSSMYRSGVVPFRGIIDGGYCGDMIVSLMNVGQEDYAIKYGDRIAQLIPHKIIDIELVQVDQVSDEYNIRGTKGFGSSGR